MKKFGLYYRTAIINHWCSFDNTNIFDYVYNHVYVTFPTFTQLHYNKPNILLFKQ